MQPLANSYLSEEALKNDEPRYRLAVAYCPECYLVQLADTVPPKELFGEYLYFSSYSESFLKHAAEMAETLKKRFGLGKESFVLEIASNDGYLLRNLVKVGIPVLGVEPARNIAEAAVKDGIPTLCEFFNEKSAKDILEKHGPADVIIGNNVLAHVPDVNDFIKTVKKSLKGRGAAVFEVPWLKELLGKSEFDTIYHEHVFYYSLSALVRLFERGGLEVFDVEAHPVHGGSLRVFVCSPGTMTVSESVGKLLEEEKDAGLTEISRYKEFAGKVEWIREELLTLLKELNARGKSVAAYGAAAKGTVMLNYCGTGKDMVDFVVDRNPHKQGRYMPGVHIPIHPPEHVKKMRPDYLLILPWNLKDEIMEQMDYIRKWGGKFIVAIPRVEVL
jgi:SAM-dependent methyltransferase